MKVGRHSIASIPFRRVGGVHEDIECLALGECGSQRITNCLKNERLCWEPLLIFETWESAVALRRL
jgi:hypothetical protein